MSQDRRPSGAPPRRMQLSPAARRAAAARRRKRIRRNRILFALAVLAVVLVVVLGVRALFSLGGGKTDGSSVPESSSGSAAAPTPTPAASTSVDFTDARMILVNNNMGLPEGYTVETQTADENTGKQLQTEAAQSFAAMQAAAKLDGVSLILQSGYRSVEYQQGLFDQQVEKMIKTGKSEEEALAAAQKVVAKPGHSEHSTGYAADILTDSYRVMDSLFAETDAYTWLTEHAAEYGFIERYPLDGEPITGIFFEPWHWRYVGAENAAEIKKSGRCLEAFWALYGSSAGSAPESGSGSSDSGSDAGSSAA